MSEFQRQEMKRLAFAFGWLIAFRAAGQAVLGPLSAALELEAAIQELGALVTLTALLAFWMCFQRGALPGLYGQANADGMAAFIRENARYQASLARARQVPEPVLFGNAGALPKDGRAVPVLSSDRALRAGSEQRAAERIRALRKQR